MKKEDMQVLVEELIEAVVARERVEHELAEYHGMEGSARHYEDLGAQGGDRAAELESDLSLLRPGVDAWSARIVRAGTGTLTEADRTEIQRALERARRRRETSPRFLMEQSHVIYGILNDHPSYKLIAGKGHRHLIARTRSSKAVALVWHGDAPITREDLETVYEEAESEGLERPIKVYGTSTTVVPFEDSWEFHQLQSEDLRRYGVAPPEPNSPEEKAEREHRSRVWLERRAIADAIIEGKEDYRPVRGREHVIASNPAGLAVCLLWGPEDNRLTLDDLKAMAGEVIQEDLYFPMIVHALDSRAILAGRHQWWMDPITPEVLARSGVPAEGTGS